MTTEEALAAALAVAHQVVYGYGVVAAHLAGAQRDAALERLQQHELLRDRVAAALAAEGGPQVAPSSAYSLPFRVDAEATALRLAARLEDGSAGAGWDVIAVAAAGSDVRRLGLALLDGAAQWSARWHSRLGSPLPALPGEPAS